MTTLHDIQTICNKEQMNLSLALAQALEEFDRAREEGDKLGEKMMAALMKMILEQMKPIEE
tara:strand:- start:1030 stop:1212 length:183 start_codon:yes stop_codon:yes gene_type:complete